MLSIAWFVVCGCSDTVFFFICLLSVDFFLFHTTPTNTFTVNGAIHRTQGGVEPSIERCLGLTALANGIFRWRKSQMKMASCAIYTTARCV